MPSLKALGSLLRPSKASATQLALQYAAKTISKANVSCNVHRQRFGANAFWKRIQSKVENLQNPLFLKSESTGLGHSIKKYGRKALESVEGAVEGAMDAAATSLEKAKKVRENQKAEQQERKAERAMTLRTLPAPSPKQDLHSTLSVVADPAPAEQHASNAPITVIPARDGTAKITLSGELASKFTIGADGTVSSELQELLRRPAQWIADSKRSPAT